MSKEVIQSQFIQPENGSLYYEVYFKVITNKPIEFAAHQRIERLIEIEVNKLNKND